MRCAVVAVWIAVRVAVAQAVPAPFRVSYDLEHLDLDGHVLQFRMSRPAGTAELVAIGEDGSKLGSGTATYRHEAPGTWLSIGWTQPDGARVMTLALRVVSADGQVTTVELIPWSVTIEHDDVSFATDRATLDAGEDTKLEASLAKITEVAKRSARFVKLQLYVAWHTDTVGASAQNRKLSLDRARTIALYFRSHGLAMPIAFAGFGEDVLKVKTRDEVDERANRRADYVLAPLGAPPPFKGPYLRVHADWKQLR